MIRQTVVLLIPVCSATNPALSPSQDPTIGFLWPFEQGGQRVA